MELDISVNEFFDQYYLPEFENWKIKKTEKEYVKFDPMIVLHSLMESEIPIRESFKIYDYIIDNLLENSQNDELTFQEIHTTVVEALLNYEDERSIEWLRNYHNIYGPEIIAPSDDDQYVMVRNVSNLKSCIVDYLTENYHLPNKLHFDKYSKRNELDEATNRIIKIIRYCGFYKVHKEFIKNFCEELAQHSIKGYLPTPKNDSEFIENCLLETEANMNLARIWAHTNRVRHFKHLDLAFEVIAQAVLSANGIINNPSTMTSFLKFIQMLEDGSRSEKDLSVCLDPPSIFYGEVLKIFKKLSIQFNRFMKHCKAINEKIVSKKAEGVEELSEMANEVIDVMKILLGDSKKIEEIDLRSRREDILGYFKTLNDFLEHYNFNTKLFLVDNEIELDISRTKSGLLQYTNILKFKYIDRCSVTENDIGKIVHYFDKKTNRDEAIIFLTNSKPSPEEIINIKKFVINNSLIMYVSTFEKFNRFLYFYEKLPEKLYLDFQRIFPYFKKEYNIVFEKPKISDSVPLYLNEEIENALSSFSNDNLLEATIKLFLNFENLFLNHILFLIEFSKKRGFSYPLENSLIDVNGIGGYIHILKKSKNVYQLRRFLPNNNDYDLFHRIRVQRNKYTHGEEDISIDKIKGKQVISDCIEGINIICAKYMNRKIGCIHDYCGRHFFVNENVSDLLLLEKNNALWFDKKIDNCIVNLVWSKTKKKYFIIRQTTVCQVCKRPIPLAIDVKENFINCEYCKHQMRPKKWEGDLLKITKNELLSIQIENPTGATIMGKNVNTKFNWVKAIGEGVATAAGPMGAPIKLLLSLRNDDDKNILNKLIETSFEENNVKIDKIEQLLSKTNEKVSNELTLFKEILMNITDKIFEYYKGDLHDTYSYLNSKRWPFFCTTNLTEKELKKEFILLYSDIELLKTDLINCDYPIERIKFTNTLETDVNNIVLSMRGKKVSYLKNVFEYLYDKNDGSMILFEISEQLSKHKTYEDSFIEFRREQKRLSNELN